MLALFLLVHLARQPVVLKCNFRFDVSYIHLSFNAQYLWGLRFSFGLTLPWLNSGLLRNCWGFSLCHLRVGLTLLNSDALSLWGDRLLLNCFLNVLYFWIFAFSFLLEVLIGNLNWYHAIFGIWLLYWNTCIFFHLCGKFLNFCNLIKLLIKLHRT